MNRRSLISGAAAMSAMATLPGGAEAATTQPPGLTSAFRNVVLPQAGRHWCAVGDSYVARNGALVGTTVTTSMLGEIEALKVLSRQAFVFNLADVFGTTGGTLVDVIGHLPAILAGGYNVCVVQGCHNDFLTLVSMATVQANYKYIIATLIAANIVPVIVLGGPIDTSALGNITTDQCRKMNLAANTWKRQYCSSIGVLTWDWATPLTDVSSTGGGYGAGMSVDQIHPSLKGSFACAKQGLIDLAPLLKAPTLSQLSGDVLDVIDPSNPGGHLGPSGQFWAGGGTVSAPVTGTVPAGWFGGRGSGAAAGGTMASSLVASADGIGQWWQMAISGVTTGGLTNEGVAMNMFGAGIAIGGTTYAIGDQIESWLDVNVLANSPFNNLRLSLSDKNKDATTLGVNVNATAPSGELAGPTYAWSGILRTPILTIPADTAGATARTLLPSFLIQWDGSGNNFSGTIQIRRWTTRKVLS